MESVYSRSGVRHRGYITSCGTPPEPLTAADLSAITYTVYQVSMTGLAPVTGHTDIAVPLSCVLSPPRSDSKTGGDYNFEHTVSAVATLPFAKRGSSYMVEYVFRDADGEPHVSQIMYRAQ